MDLDTLFTLPLAEFTAARNELAKRLSQKKLVAEAERVKALSKPSVSAWAVNQLYWKHRKQFDALLEAGTRLGQAHAAQLAGKTADVQKPLAARRAAMSALLRQADDLLRVGGHGATPETIRRIETTLESLSTAAPDDPRLGRLTQDVGPMGFESFAAFAPIVKPAPAKAPDTTSAKAALQAAEGNLAKSRQVLANARAAEASALQNARDMSARAEEAAKAVDDAQQTVEQAREKLRRLEETKQ